MKNSQQSGRLRRRALPAVIAIVVASALSLSACTGSDGPNASDSTTLTLAIDTAPLSLNPAKDFYSGFPHALSSGSILRMESDGTFSPGLATSWEYVGDGFTTFEYTLREGLTFSDGTPLDAEAAAAWMNYFAGAGGDFATQLGPIESITAVDEVTVQIVLGAPNPNMPYYLSASPFNWGYLSSPANIDDPDKLEVSTAGAGQYILDADHTVSGDTYTYVPNPEYYEPSEIQFEKVVLKVLASPSAVLAALKTGQIQGAFGNFTSVEDAEAAGLEVYSSLATNVALSIMDRNGTITPALGDVRVRQALNYAIDRELIATAIVGTYGSPSSAFRTSDGFDESLTDFYEYDPARAKSLLAEAGYPDGFEFDIFFTDEPGTFTLAAAQAVADQLADVGVTMNLKVDTGAEFQADFVSGTFPAWIGDQPISPMSVLYGTYLAPEAFVNPYRVVNQQIDDLYVESLASTDPVPSYKAITRAFTEDGAWLNVFVKDSLYFHTSSLEGVDANKISSLDPTTWHLK